MAFSSFFFTFMTPQDTYLHTGRQLETATESQFFGKPCFKINGKAFIAFFNEAMVFKLNGDAHRNALALEGALLFDPSGKGRPMKEWVQVPARHSHQWPALAKDALLYVSGS